MSCDQPPCEEAVGQSTHFEIVYHQFTAAISLLSSYLFVTLFALLHLFQHSNGERRNTLWSYICQQVSVCVSVCIWLPNTLTHTIALSDATGHPMLILPPNPHSPAYALLCSAASFLHLASSFNLPVLFPLSSLASSLGLKVGTWPINTTAGSPNPGGGGGEHRERKRLTSLHTDLHTLPPSWLNPTLKPAANREWGWSASQPMALATLRRALALSLYSFQ